MKGLKVLILMLMVGVISCKSGGSSKDLVTERIQYDVVIQSPGPDYPWWVQNIEGSGREAFIKSLLNAAYSGKVQAYDNEHKPITPEQVKQIGNYTDSVYTTSPVPPYNDTLMVIQHKLEMRDIRRVRFLEEWRMDKTTLEMEKKILGIAVVRDNFDEKGEFRGTEPLFWVFFDKSYPAKFDLK